MADWLTTRRTYSVAVGQWLRPLCLLALGKPRTYSPRAGRLRRSYETPQGTGAPFSGLDLAAKHGYTSLAKQLKIVADPSLFDVVSVLRGALAKQLKKALESVRRRS
jgi:hypothetical protein